MTVTIPYFLSGFGPQRCSVCLDSGRGRERGRHQRQQRFQLALRGHGGLRRGHRHLPHDPHCRTHHHLLPLDENQNNRQEAALVSKSTQRTVMNKRCKTGVTKLSSSISKIFSGREKS